VIDIDVDRGWGQFNRLGDDIGLVGDVGSGGGVERGGEGQYGISERSVGQLGGHNSVGSREILGTWSHN